MRLARAAEYPLDWTVLDDQKPLHEADVDLTGLSHPDRNRDTWRRATPWSGSAVAAVDGFCGRSRCIGSVESTVPAHPR